MKKTAGKRMEQEEEQIETKRNFERGRMRKSKPFSSHSHSTSLHIVRRSLFDTIYKQGKEHFMSSEVSGKLKG